MMTPRKLESLNEHLNRDLSKPFPMTKPTNPITLALRVQEGKCPSCERTDTMNQMTRPEYRRTKGRINGYVFVVMTCTECSVEWVEKYVLSEVSFVTQPEKP